MTHEEILFCARISGHPYEAVVYLSLDKAEQTPEAFAALHPDSQQAILRS